MAYDKDKVFGYMRIGIYEMLSDGKMRNICDVHFFGGDDTLMKNSYFTGPDKPAQQARAVKRTDRDLAQWREESVVGDEHDIAEGGKAMMYYATSIDTHYCWLFGPLKYAGRGYGSLVLDFLRWRNPTARNAKDKTFGVVSEFTFPKLHSFQRCGMYQTDFASTRIISQMWNQRSHATELLKDVRQHLRPVAPASGVRAFRWRIEAGKSRQSERDYMTAYG